MREPDLLQRFIFENLSIRGEIVHLDESYQTILNQHPYSEGLRRLLGEALATASLLTGVIKFKGRLTIQFQGKGKLKLLLVQCTHRLHLRGLAQASHELSYEELIQELSQGVLGIMIDFENSTRRYQGMVAWRGKSFAESIEAYFKDSEQLMTRLWLSVNDQTAAGLLLQMIPEESEARDLDWQHITILTETLKPEELLSDDNALLLTKLYNQEAVRLFEPHTVIFRCTCSVERSANAIALLSEEEANEELANKQKMVVTCDFCNQEYEFDKVDVAEIFKNKGQFPTDAHIQ